MLETKEALSDVIDVSTLKPGLYFISIANDELHLTKTFFVE